MAKIKHNDPQFDNFFGAGSRNTPTHEAYSPEDDVFSRDESPHEPPVQQVAPSRQKAAAPRRQFTPHSPSTGYPRGSRQHAVAKRFGEQHAPAQRSPHRAQPPMMSEPPMPVEDYFSWDEPPRKRSSGKTAILAVLGVIIALACVGLAFFALRPADGGDYFLANGSLPQVSGLRQTQAFDNSAWLRWDPVDSVAGYKIYRTDSLTGEKELIKTAYFSFTYIADLKQGDEAEYTISPFCKTNSGVYIEDNAAAITVKTKPEDARTISHQTATADSITLGWETIEGADGYIVQRHTGSWFSYEDCADSADAEATVRSLDASTEYTFRMRPYVDLGGKRCYGKWSDKFTSATSPVAVRDLTQGGTTDSGYVLNWEVDSDFTGFELYRADPATGEATELLSQCGNTYYEISGLESVSYSSYCVRAFLRHSGGISYGEFSPVITAVTLPSKVVGVDQYTSSAGEYILSWTPSLRAEGYEIYAYSCHRDEYDLLAAVTEPEYTLGDISEYAERYKVRAYASLGDLQFFGDYSDELPCYPYYYLKRTVKVDADSTSLRTYSGPEYELITELERGTSARVFGERSGSDGSRWFRVELKDGTTGWLSREDVSITNTCGTLATREYTDEEPIVIYLSPSKQGGNPFWNGLTTEKEQMEAVGAVTHRILEEEYNCVVYTATPELELRERAFEALELKADIYLAIHSNATGTADVHYGASSYYCGASGRSKRLGESINNHLNAIAPMECTLHKQMYSALESFGGVGYAEVRDPYNLGMVSVLAETDFHDNELTGQWIIDNHEAIGRAYAEALAETFDIPEKQ